MERIYKRVFGGTTIEEHYVMNGSELVAVIKNGAVSYWKTSYGRYEKSGSGYTAYYYLTDHLGSTRVVLREDGIRTEAYDYYAFGLTLPGRTYGSGTKEKFTGKERDLETGWDYFGARYYNPTIARWMNVDPLADKYPSWSPYNYVMNSPIMMIDPDGKEGEEATEPWKPDEHGNYVAEQGDTFQSFMQDTGANQAEASKVFQESGLSRYLPENSCGLIPEGTKAKVEDLPEGTFVAVPGGSYDVVKSYVKFMPYEGVGLHASGTLRMSASISQDGKELTIAASGSTVASQLGNAEFSGTTTIGNSTKILNKPDGPTFGDSTRQYAGLARFDINQGDKISVTTSLRLTVRMPPPDGALSMKLPSIMLTLKPPKRF